MFGAVFVVVLVCSLVPRALYSCVCLLEKRDIGLYFSVSLELPSALVALRTSAQS